ncbi:hypothetical protein Ahy_B01g055803 isoform L [Arachis hypogaea]|uniref:DUF223 domain-containing protein n=1 Tax=Arachis hypogaea TaxID=3818 RepID=A0A445AX48_ARAHY|nr:hypothetical protein Ahy_B01g055803 isoform L [Arachis hypogaea]
MATSVTLLKDIASNVENPSCKIKVRVIKIWSVRHSEQKYQKPMLDMVYKPTNHAQQIYFKRDTQIRTVQDNSFPINMFQFVPNELILNHTNAQSHFIDNPSNLTGTMGISNTNYNSILHINANRKEVKEFRQSIIMSGVPPANRLSQLAAKPIYNLEDDLINQSTYKSISELKETIEVQH